MLFLGCGLASDRTMKVVRSCSGALDHFALVGLTEDTENQADPYAPILREADGALKLKYNKKRKTFISPTASIVFGIRFGMHAEAMEVLLTKLSERYKKKNISNGTF